MRPLPRPRRDGLQLLGFWLIGGALCSAFTFVALRQLLEPQLIEALSDHITQKVVLTEALLDHEPAAKLPPGLQTRLSRPGADLPGLAPGWGGFDRQLQWDLDHHHGLVRRLLRASHPLGPELAGYWVALASRGPGGQQQWLSVPPAYDTLPFFWPLVRTFTIFGGAVVGLLLFLQLRVEQPLRRLLQALPEPQALPEIRPLVPELGVAPVQALARRMNLLIEEHNGRVASRREQLRGLVHDIRSPLSRLLLRHQLLLRQPNLEALAKALPTMESDLAQLRDLADQLSHLASAERSEPELSTFSLDALCARIAKSYAAGAVQLHVPRLLVRLNQELLQRCLINLVDNALEYGEPPVLIRAESLGHRGLAIVQRFCHDHGGELRLMRAPSGGLRACLLLPRALQLEG